VQIGPLETNPQAQVENGATAPPYQKLSQTSPVESRNPQGTCPTKFVEWLIGFPKHQKLKKKKWHVGQSSYSIKNRILGS
jgi:hypothetical protein